MAFKKRPKEIRKTIAEFNADESATVIKSFERERKGDGTTVTKTVFTNGDTKIVTQVSQ